MILNYANIRVGINKVNRLYNGVKLVYGEKHTSPIPIGNKINIGDILYANYTAQDDGYGNKYLINLGTPDAEPVGIAVVPKELLSGDYIVTFMYIKDYIMDRYDSVREQAEDLTYYTSVPYVNNPYTTNRVDKYITGIETVATIATDSYDGYGQQIYANNDLMYTGAGSTDTYHTPAIIRKWTDNELAINDVATAYHSDGNVFYCLSTDITYAIDAYSVLNNHIEAYSVLARECPSDTYIPDIGVLSAACTYKNKLNEILEQIGGDKFCETSTTNNFDYISCTQYSDSRIWYLTTSNYIYPGTKSGTAPKRKLRPFYYFWVEK